jgi:hypothetical protein
MNPMEDYVKFKNKAGETLWFVKIVNKQAMVWKEIKEGHVVGGRLDPATVNEQILTDADIWDELPVSFQECVTKAQEADIKAQEEIVTAQKDKMAHARKQRKTRDKSLPKEMICKCGKKVVANWTILNKKADKLGIPAVDLAKNYVCQSCKPTKGRKKK